MYKVVKDIPKLIITLDMMYLPEPDEIAAAIVNHPTSIKSRYRLDDDRLRLLNDIVDTTISFIRSHKFKILRTYQSKKSYSVYVRFQPYSENNEPLDPVEVIFRIADHSSDSLQKDGKIKTGRAYIRSFWVKDKDYKDIRAFTHEIDVICDELASGDYSSFS